MTKRLSSVVRALPVLLAVLLLGSTAGRAACVRAAAAGRRGHVPASAAVRTRAVASQSVIDPVALEPHSATPQASLPVAPLASGQAAIVFAPTTSAMVAPLVGLVVPQCSTCAHSSRAPPRL